MEEDCFCDICKSKLPEVNMYQSILNHAPAEVTGKIAFD